MPEIHSDLRVGLSEHLFCRTPANDCLYMKLIILLYLQLPVVTISFNVNDHFTVYEILCQIHMVIQHFHIWQKRTLTILKTYFEEFRRNPSEAPIRSLSNLSRVIWEIFGVAFSQDISGRLLLKGGLQFHFSHSFSWLSLSLIFSAY